MEEIPSITHLSNDVLLDSFCPEGFVDIVVSIVTDVFVRSFVDKTCRDIIDDVEKLDVIQGGFIHSNLSDFDNPPGFNILIHTLCLIIVVFYNSNTWTVKYMTRF